MKGLLAVRRTATMALVAVTAVFAAAGCAKKVTTVDTSVTKLEGVPSDDAHLISLTEHPTYVFKLAHDVSGEPVMSDTVFTMPSPVAATYHFQLLDKTAATEFQTFRAPSSGGFLAMADYTLRPSIKWLETGWELYSFSTTPPGNPSNSTYIARGVVGSVVGTKSPLTNFGPVLGNGMRETMTIVWPLLHGTESRSLAAADTSGAPLSFIGDTRASGYWIELLAFDDIRTDPETFSQLDEALPVFEALGRSRAIRYYVPATTSATQQVRLSRIPAQPDTARAPLLPPPSSTQGGGQYVTYKMQLFFYKNYLIRMVAVDASGHVINRLKSDYYAKSYDTGVYYFPVGGQFFDFTSTHDRENHIGDPISNFGDDIATASPITTWSQIYNHALEVGIAETDPTTGYVQIKPDVKQLPFSRF